MNTRKEIERLRNRIRSACAERFSGSAPVFGEGPLPCAVMVIGEAPGRDETRLGRPFVGKGGSFFIKVLEEALGLKRDDIYITNVLKVWPNVRTKRLRTRKPDKAETEFFLPLLMEEVRIAGPEVIIAVGKTAFFALVPDGPFKAGHWTEHKGTPVMPVYHPSYMLRRRKSLDESVAELKGALQEVSRRLGP